MNLLKNLIFEKDEQVVIAEIHNEFDTAEDRLLKQANEILSELNPTPHEKIEEKAERLHKLGFVNTPIVKNAEVIKKERKKIETQIVKTKSEAELIQYYKFNYPFLKFLTVDELDKICNKYNLIYAPVNNFIKDVPSKNLKEIEAAHPLKKTDIQKNLSFFKVKSFWFGVPSKIKSLLRKEVQIDTHFNEDNVPNDSTIMALIKTLGYAGEYKGYIYRKATVRVVSQEGLFICAPPSNFNLKGIKKHGKLGYFHIQKFEIKDPIVFRYCRGGVQVLSKWGLEANDEALVNEINN